MKRKWLGNARLQVWVITFFMVAVLSEAPDARGQNREETSPATLETNAEDLDDLLNDLDGTQESNSKYLTGWKGFVEIKPRFYLRDRNESKNDEQLLFISEFEFDFRFAEHLTGYFRPRIYVDGFDNELRRFEPFEGYLTYKSDRWDIRAGQFVENWGIVDTFNPIDIVNRRDFATDILDPDHQGKLCCLGFNIRQLAPQVTDRSVELLVVSSQLGILPMAAIEVRAQARGLPEQVGDQQSTD